MSGRAFNTVTVRNGLRLYEPSGSDSITLTAPALSTSLTLTLPSSAGSASDFLQTNGSGTLSWAAPSHLALSNLTGGTFTDGGHTYLAQLKSAAAAPAATDDLSAYKVGTIWTDTTVTGGQPYICAYNASTAAVWRKLLYSGGTVVADAGAVGAPSITVGDATTGIYKIGTDNIGVAIAGVNKVNIASTGTTLAGKVTVSGGSDPGFIAPDGTLTLPAFRFTNNSNSGLYSIGSNNLGLVINGATLLNCNATGLGVGQAAAAEKLEVNGNLKAQYFKTSNTNVVAANAIPAALPDAGHVVAGAGAASAIGVGSSNGIYIGNGAAPTAVADTGSVVLGYRAGYSFSTVTARKTLLGYGAGYYGTDLSGSTIVGDQAGYGVTGQTGGTNNTLVGLQAGYGITTAANNVAMGGYAGCKMTTGTYNTCLGYEAGGVSANSGITTGTYNVAIGSKSMGELAMTATRNIGIGELTLARCTSGEYNIAIGTRALYEAATTMTGGYNIGIGFVAGNKITSGVNNTLMGSIAGGALTTGSYNTAVGYQTAFYTTTAVGSACFGYQSGSAILSGTANLALGYGAMSGGSGTATGGRNIAIGDSALSGGITSGERNIAIGELALAKTTTGAYNIGLGNATLYDSGTTNAGTYNIAIGEAAGSKIATSNYNICIGSSAGQAIKSGTNSSPASQDENIAIGLSAMGGASVTYAGIRNVAIGTGALGGALAYVSGDQASYNVAIGFHAGYTITTGYYNAMIGLYAGNVITTGNNNTCYGVFAGKGITEGSSNVAIGMGAMSDATQTSAANANVAIGSSALFVLTSGTRNICSGVDAGKAITTGSSNVCYGDSTGAAIVGGSYNTCIGPGANVAGASDINEIVIGYNATGAGSNTTVIGNSSTTSCRLYGTLGLDAATSPTLTLGDTGTPFTISSQTCYKQMIGKWLHFTFAITWSGKGTATQVLVSGLGTTFSSAQTVTCGPVSTNGPIDIRAIAVNGTDSIYFYKMTNGAYTNVAVADMATSGTMYASGIVYVT